MGVLYSVALPIGNFLDITLRSKEILATVDFIAAEDTRKVKDWLKRCNITTKARILAYHSQNEEASARGILELLKQGKSVALVADAGTPRICDPGYWLLRYSWESKITVKPVPGASALTSILSVAPIPTLPLLFLGFLSPNPSKRRRELEKYRDFQGTIALYESRHRLISLLVQILEIWPQNTIFIGRELTKEHEEFFWGPIEKSLLWARDKKGEFVILLDCHKKT